MSKIFLTSDTHFGHDREFIWKVRGFNSVEEMNETIVQKWNKTVSAEDDAYILGDVILGDPVNIEYVKRLNGKLHIVLGNHDTPKREEMYRNLPNVVEVAEVGIRLKYKKHHFVLTHYPTMTGNLEKESLKQMSLNLYGHTHQASNFYNDTPFMYHVGVDSHDCYPALLDDIIDEMYAKVKECVAFLDEQPAVTGPQTPKERCDSCKYVLYCRGVGLADFEGDCKQYARAEMARLITPLAKDPPDGGFYG